jgi:hypothetical protein
MIAWILLIVGADYNANVSRPTAPICIKLKDGVFAGAGRLSLAATAMGITSYIMLRNQQAAPGAPTNKRYVQPVAAAGTGIAMGHPQFPLPHGHPQV